ncbi:MAG TPA: hypothetical protein VGU90_05380, partial [Terriglobales bacterium]|nr:hypothetical protein [Terriglobales bacterium]
MNCLFQRLACVFDVLPEKLAGSLYVSFAAQGQDLVMLLISALDAVRQVQLQPGVSFSAIVYVANDGHRMRPLGARIEYRVELPIQPSP